MVADGRVPPPREGALALSRSRDPRRLSVGDGHPPHTESKNSRAIRDPSPSPARASAPPSPTPAATVQACARRVWAHRRG